MLDLNKIKNKLIVSCQALKNEPLYGSFFMAKMAMACVEGGAKAIRANGVEDIKAIKEHVSVPVIGLIKYEYNDSDVYITPTKKEVLALLNTDCEIIALDATKRKRPGNENLKDLLKLIHNHNRIALGDISTLNEAIEAEKLGFDLVSTTLSGYTSYSRQIEGPDIKLVKECKDKLKIGVIAEGRISETSQLKEILKLQPFAIVIGSAITRPQLITRKFSTLFNN